MQIKPTIKAYSRLLAYLTKCYSEREMSTDVPEPKCTTKRPPPGQYDTMLAGET